jgi:ABC-type transport system substrate-binding protein
LGRIFVPQTCSFEYYWQPPPAVYDPAKAKELLAAAGFPYGFDAGPFTVDSSYSNMGEATVDYLQQVGIRCGLVPMERAAFASALPPLVRAADLRQYYIYR